MARRRSRARVAFERRSCFPSAAAVWRAGPAEPCAPECRMLAPAADPCGGGASVRRCDGWGRAEGLFASGSPRSGRFRWMPAAAVARGSTGEPSAPKCPALTPTAQPFGDGASVRRCDGPKRAEGALIPASPLLGCSSCVSASAEMCGGTEETSAATCLVFAPAAEPCGGSASFRRCDGWKRAEGALTLAIPLLDPFSCMS